MKVSIYSVYDSKAEAYLQPFFSQSNGTAIRAFEQAVNGETEFSKYPADFTLFKIGEFSDESATLTPVDPVSLGNGVEFKKQLRNPNNEIRNVSSVQSSTID